MHEPDQRVLDRNRRQQPSDVRRISHITSRDRDLATQTRELRDQLGRTLRIRTTTTGQHQMTNPMLSDQMTGQMRTDTTRATRDQHRARRIEANRPLTDRGDRNKPRNTNTALPTALSGSPEATTDAMTEQARRRPSR